MREVLVTANVQVDAGAPLMLSRRSAARRQRAWRSRSLRGRAARARRRAACFRRALEGLRRLLLGFDMDAAYARRFVTEWGSCCAEPLRTIRS